MDPTLLIGGVPIPQASYERLGAPERQGLADLIGFGAAVTHGETADLGAPIVERAVLRSRLANLPYQLGAASVGFDDSILRSLYQRSPEWELVVSHIIRLADAASSRAARDSARTIAEEVAKRAREGDDFASLASRYSQEPGAAQRGGRLEPGRRGSWVAPFWTAALVLQPGQTSEVVESEFGFHVIKLEERRPVPFEEADRAALLRLVVPAEATRGAMEEWATLEGAITFDDAAVDSAHQRIVDGATVPENLVLARDVRGATYEGSDLAAGWTTLAPAERASIERGERPAFSDWLARDAREVLGGKFAQSIGVPADADAAGIAAGEWNWTIAEWAAAFQITPAMSDRQLLDATMAALLSGDQEPRAARLGLRSLRPLLRQRYPVIEPHRPDPPGELQ